MNFRDRINNTIQNSNYEAEEAQRKQEAVQQEVNGVCDWVRKRIEYKAACHPNPNIPFEVNMYFVCSLDAAFVMHGEVIPRGRDRYATRVSQITLSEDILIREKLIRDQLKSDGITVGKWELYNAAVSDDDRVSPRPKYLCSYANAFGVYDVNEIRIATRVNIDPYKPITTTSRYGLFANTWFYTYSQGGNSIRPQPGLELYLLMPISFS